MRLRENKWRLETPIKDQADGAVVENLLSDLESWQKEGTIPAKDIDTDKSKLAEYGLSNPKLKLKLLGREKPPEILFGKYAALEGRMYVRFQNSKETYLATQSEEHTSELQSPYDLVCRLLLEKKKRILKTLN